MCESRGKGMRVYTSDLRFIGNTSRLNLLFSVDINRSILLPEPNIFEDIRGC